MKLKTQTFLVLVGLSMSILSCSENYDKKNDIEKEIIINKKFLNIPLLLDRNAPKSNLSIKIDGDLLGTFEIPLAQDKEDYYGFIDLSQHLGKTLAVELDSFSRDL